MAVDRAVTVLDNILGVKNPVPKFMCSCKSSDLGPELGGNCYYAEIAIQQTCCLVFAADQSK